MDRKPELEIAVRDTLITSLKKENKIQDQLIREQKTMIRILEHQNTELRELLEQILKA